MQHGRNFCCRYLPAFLCAVPLQEKTDTNFKKESFSEKNQSFFIQKIMNPLKTSRHVILLPPRRQVYRNLRRHPLAPFVSDDYQRLITIMLKKRKTSRLKLKDSWKNIHYKRHIHTFLAHILSLCHFRIALYVTDVDKNVFVCSCQHLNFQNLF